MIHYLTARMRPELKVLTHANYKRIYAQLDRLEHDPFHAIATAMVAAVLDKSVALYGAASTAEWLANMSNYLAAEDDSDLGDHGGKSA